MKPGQKHFVVYANVSEAERDHIREQAELEGLSLSDFVRRCINGYLVEVGIDGPLLAEKRSRDRVAA